MMKICLGSRTPVMSSSSSLSAPLIPMAMTITPFSARAFAGAAGGSPTVVLKLFCLNPLEILTKFQRLTNTPSVMTTATLTAPSRAPLRGRKILSCRACRALEINIGSASLACPHKEIVQMSHVPVAVLPLLYGADKISCLTASFVDNFFKCVMRWTLSLYGTWAMRT